MNFAAAMMSMGPMVWGYSLVNLLMIGSGVFYLICAFLLWKPLRRERNELMGALFAFLVYQAISMFFMGLQMQTMDMKYGFIAALAIFIGSAYMLKFPFSSFSWATRRILFYLSLAAAIALFVWFMQTPARQMQLMHFVLWYDIVINGLIVGGSIILYGLKVTGIMRIKTLGGGTGVMSCCVAANAAMISGAMFTSSVFAFAAPVLILGSIAFSRKKQNAQNPYMR
jgi:hypothetical protein